MNADPGLYLGLLAAYLALQVAIGVWLGRRVKTAGAFFVAGRQLGPGLMFATLVAANIGAGSTLGAAGEGYRLGIGAWWWVGSAGLGSIVLALVVGPRLRRIAADRGLRTAGDYLEYRYGAGVRTAVTALLWIGTLAVLASQLISSGIILQSVTGLPLAAGVVLGGAVATAYFAAGGLMTAVWINLLQIVFEVGVMMTLVPLAISRAGGWEGLVSAPAPPGYWDFLAGWRHLVVLGPAFVVSPGLIQKVYAARDDRAVTLGVGANAALLVVFALVPVLLGIAARALHPGLEHPQLALPTLILSDLPPVIGALALAVLFTTGVNTADTVLFMLSTSLAQDLYRGHVNPAADDAQVLRVARVSALAGGVLGVAVALAATSIITTLSIFYTLVGVSLFVPVVGGLFVPRAGRAEAVASISAGVGVTLVLHVATAGQGAGPVTPALAGIAASAVAFGAVLASGRPAEARGLGPGA
jgi:SSS family solute:Na+ symporter